MGKLFSILSSLLLLVSCGEQYTIAGSSSVPCLDGRMLYLQATPEGFVQHTAQISRNDCLDSCKVVHGRFSFVGDVDSVVMAMLYTEEQCVMPVVIENGKLSIQVDNVTQRVSGGPLNEKLYTFFRQKNRIENEMCELQLKCLRMMRDGYTPEEIDRKVGKKAEKLTRQSEELDTHFVMENYDNVLGPSFFMMLCSQYPTPIMTEQISHIIKNAPPTFTNNPYVHSYIREAKLRTGSIDE